MEGGKVLGGQKAADLMTKIVIKTEMCSRLNRMSIEVNQVGISEPVVTSGACCQSERFGAGCTGSCCLGCVRGCSHAGVVDCGSRVVADTTTRGEGEHAPHRGQETTRDGC